MDIDYLKQLIEDGIEESLTLEYKSATSIGRSEGIKNEIAKDVSSFANSAGGRLIYGINEFRDTNKRHLPERIDPIDRTQFSREWLEQVINSNIHPKISDVIITPVSINDTQVVYIIDIPQSDTAHQAADKRYYKRRNFSSVPMEDYEIRDIFNRRGHPKISVELEILKSIYFDDPIYNPFNKHDEVVEYRLHISLHNIGKVYGKYVNFFVYIPFDIVDQKKMDVQTKTIIENIEYFVFSGENTIRDFAGLETSNSPPLANRGTTMYKPILPGVRIRVRDCFFIQECEINDRLIFWELYADNAELNKGYIKLSDIPVIIVDRTKSSESHA